MTTFETIAYIIEKTILVYAVSIFISYVILALVSTRELWKYMRRRKFIDYNNIISSPFAPSISIIAPAYNESQSIVENIRAMLSLFYHDYEVIIVNDGSTDDTLEKMIEAYDLVEVDFAYEYKVTCQEIRRIYRSKNKSYANLTIVDKVNGGSKADAMNGGINVAKNDYILAIDADSILAPDTLLKLAKPFMEEKDKRVIGVGGVLRVVNSSEVKGGQIIKLNFPKNILARFQVIEYTRAFLMGRVAWSKLDGLLIISGALGMFDRDIVVKCGGYNSESIGEDMELVIRMRKFMMDHEEKYKVVYIPDPLCYTEVPETLKDLGKQRNRWSKGTIDNLISNRSMILRPRYKMIGMVSMPYWFIFERMAPIVELFGVIYFLTIAALGHPNWPFFFIMLGFVYLFSITFSTYALLFEEMTFHRFERKRDLMKLFLLTWIEPLIYHPLVFWWSLRGNMDFYILGKRGWNYVKKKGFRFW